MAEHVVPHAKPREQLRTEAPSQRKHDDKYVTAFVSGRADVDITMRNPLLESSADHYMVGVDELALNISGLSMLEFKRRGLDQNATNQDADPSGLDWSLGARNSAAQIGSTFQISRPFTNMQDITQRLNEIARYMTEYLHGAAMQDPALYPKNWDPFEQTAATSSLVRIYLNAAGQLVVDAPLAFWANFVIQIPNEMYQQSITGVVQEWFGINPFTLETDNPRTAEGHVAVRLDDNGNAPVGPTHDYSTIADPNVNPAPPKASFIFRQNLCNTLDRRVTIELSCSLPIKNSPMIDHDKESPDYTLGRWVFQREMSIQINVKSHLISHDFGLKQLQDSTKRVTYHHLRPQQKIQVVRLRLWARVRTYSAIGGWSMNTIIVPMNANDYWHARLHFVSK